MKFFFLVLFECFFITAMSQYLIPTNCTESDTLKVSNAINDRKPPARIVILGTVHTGNKVFNHKEIYAELKRQKPDIILIENSRVPKKIWGKPISKLFGKKFNNEPLAYEKYKRRNKNVLILPFDTAINSANYFTERTWVTKTLIGERLDSLYNSNRIDNADKRVLERLSNLFGKSNPFIELPLDTLNLPWMQDTVRAYHRVLENDIANMVTKYLNDTATLRRLNDFNKNWHLRNDYMVRSIKMVASKYPDHKIVVLVGLGHKYFLEDELSRLPAHFSELIPFPKR